MAYWLLKTEPDEFSIDDLRAVGIKGEPWDGIRNYQARNIMRDQIKIGDMAFIYHSSCKNVGVVGVAEIIKEAYDDPAQFSPESKYFDAKATLEKPRWVCVDVKFVSQFDEIVSLKTIKQTPQLSSMKLVTQGRLSVQPVTTKEWRVINQLAKS